MSKKESKNPTPTCSCHADPSAASADSHGFAAAGPAQGPPYDAMVISCIDPRMQTPVYKYLKKREPDRGFLGRYSQLTIAGAGIAGVAPAMESWHPAFWDNLGTSLKLHQFPKVILIQHRACGAATVAYGHVAPGSKAEKKLHRFVAEEFQRQLLRRHPQLSVEAILMGLDGAVEKLLT